MVIAEKIGQRIKESRVAAGFSGVELAKKVGVSKQVLNNWEAGRRIPLLESVVSLSKELGISVGYLLCVNDNPKTPHNIEVPLFDVDTVINRTSEKKIIIPNNISHMNSIQDDSFAFVLSDDAMFPFFKKGDIIIISPIKPQDNDLVLAQIITTQQIVFRKYIIDTSSLSNPKYFLKPYNESFNEIQFDDSHVKILGVCRDNIKLVV